MRQLSAVILLAASFAAALSAQEKSALSPVLGEAGNIGSLKSGRRADMVVLKGDPAATSTT